ncbi:MAG: hypothetical protein WBB43_27055 [Limnoraphis sp.]
MDVSLIRVANSRNWEYGGDWLRVESEQQANFLLGLFSEAFSATSQKISKDFLLKWGREPDQQVPIPPFLADSINQTSTQDYQTMTDSIIVPGITLAPMRLSEPLIRLFLDEFIANPHKRLTLVRRDTKNQVAVSEALRSQILRPGVTLADVVKRTTWDYTYWPDIEQVETDTRLLTPNDSNSSLIVQTRKHDTTGQNWRLFTSRIRLIQDDYGDIFHFGEGLDVEPCAPPPNQ